MDAEVERDKLTPEQRGDFARFAWEKGRTAALECQAAHPGLSPTALAERLGVPVARRPGRSAAYSQYEEKQRQIVLFGAMVAAYAEENKRELGDLPAEELFVAHELFHFLECTDPAVGPTWRQREVTVFRSGASAPAVRSAGAVRNRCARLCSDLSGAARRLTIRTTSPDCRTLSAALIPPASARDRRNCVFLP